MTRVLDKRPARMTFPPEWEPRELPDIRVSVVESGEVIAEGRTDADGGVTLEVPQGTHVVHVDDVLGLRTPDLLLLTVVSREETGGIVTYESGLRFESDEHRP